VLWTSFFFHWLTSLSMCRDFLGFFRWFFLDSSPSILLSLSSFTAPFVWAPFVVLPFSFCSPFGSIKPWNKFNFCCYLNIYTILIIEKFRVQFLRNRCMDSPLNKHPNEGFRLPLSHFGYKMVQFPPTMSLLWTQLIAESIDHCISQDSSVRFFIHTIIIYKLDIC